jgi:hypothetical protein
MAANQACRAKRSTPHSSTHNPPTSAQQQQIGNFESGVFTGQLFNNTAKFLNADGATGGPVALQNQLAGFLIGINDPLGLNPKGTPLTSAIFDLYQAWRNIGSSGDDANRSSVARGEDLFNKTPINITNVPGSTMHSINQTFRVSAERVTTLPKSAIIRSRRR